jgi:hypothetical protein
MLRHMLGLPLDSGRVSRPRVPKQIREIDGRSQGKGGATRSAFLLGSPRRGRGGSEDAPGPLTPASAPPGVPAKSQISWGGMAPGRLAREDARNIGGGTLR